MEDLLQSQIRENCKLAMPDGLKDLMYDISREVLRARPQNLCQFIADYLSVMLIAREKLTNAVHVCKDICNTSCQPELDEELKNIDLSDEEAAKAKKIIIEYLENDQVKEENILVKLLKTNIDGNKLPAIQRAIQAAYRRSQINRHTLLHGTSSDDEDVTKRAAKHTLKLYWKEGPPGEEYPHINDDVESSFGNHGDRKSEKDDQEAKTSSTESSEDMFMNIRYDGGIQDLYVSKNCEPYRNSSLTSLAGSFSPLRRAKGSRVNNVSDNEKFLKSHQEDHRCCDNQVIDKLSKRQVQIDLSDIEDVNDEIHTAERDQIIREVDDNKVELVEDVAIDAGDESDTSIDEEIDAGSMD